MTVAITSMASSLELPESALFLFWLRTLRHKLLNTHYQDAPTTSLGRVKIHGPFAVTATVCSKCAE